MGTKLKCPGQRWINSKKTTVILKFIQLQLGQHIEIRHGFRGDGIRCELSAIYVLEIELIRVSIDNLGRCYNARGPNDKIIGQRFVLR